MSNPLVGDRQYISLCGAAAVAISESRGYVFDFSIVPVSSSFAENSLQRQG